MAETEDFKEPGSGNNYIKRYLGLIILSIGLSRLPIGNLFFVVPLLLLAPRCRTKSQAYLSFVFVFGVISILAITDVSAVADTDLRLSLAVVTSCIPVILLGTGMLWVYGKDKGIEDFLNYFINCFFVLLISLAVVLFFYLNPTRFEALKQGYSEMLTFVGIDSLVPGIDIKVLMDTIVKYGMLVFFAFAMGIVGLNLFMSEILRNKRNEAWKKKISLIKFPQDAIWGFLGLSSLLLVSIFVDYPRLLDIILVNCWAFMVMMYALQGFSIYVFRIKKRIGEVDVFRLLVNQLIFLMIPGLNIVVLIMFPLLGILENWIVLRKFNNKEI
ncbi:MAG: hypothetical protein WC162_01045 [Sphaerochaetaceae bacterium]|nr:hypothetical protein [Sphaerochaetaceae bacterium]